MATHPSHTEPLPASALYSIVVFVPATHAALVREALASSGAGAIANYDSCSFTTHGTGRFRPLAGATPNIGRVGALEVVEEARIETEVHGDRLRAVIRAVRAAHPYEAPAIHVTGPLLDWAAALAEAPPEKLASAPITVTLPVISASLAPPPSQSPALASVSAPPCATSSAPAPAPAPAPALALAHVPPPAPSPPPTLHFSSLPLLQQQLQQQLLQQQQQQQQQMQHMLMMMQMQCSGAVGGLPTFGRLPPPSATPAPLPFSLPLPSATGHGSLPVQSATGHGHVHVHGQGHSAAPLGGSPSPSPHAAPTPRLADAQQ